MTMTIHRNKRRTLTGFTLIECMVVVAIVGILAGVLIRCLVTGNAGQKTAIPTAPAFAGCFHLRENSYWYWQCEDAAGLWKCNESMDRSSCVWSAPLPADHPLRRVEATHVAEVAP